MTSISQAVISWASLMGPCCYPTRKTVQISIVRCHQILSGRVDVKTISLKMALKIASSPSLTKQTILKWICATTSILSLMKWMNQILCTLSFSMQVTKTTGTTTILTLTRSFSRRKRETISKVSTNSNSTNPKRCKLILCSLRNSKKAW